MLGVGWTEMLVIGVVALIVIGPKELPALMHRVGQFAGTIRRMGQDFQRELNKTTGLNEIKNLRQSVAQPLKATADAIRKEFNTTNAAGQAQPSGAIKPADPKAESVVDEIKAQAGMAKPAALPLTAAAAAAAKAAEAGETPPVVKAPVKAKRPPKIKAPVESKVETADIEPAVKTPAKQKATSTKAVEPAAKPVGTKPKSATKAGAAPAKAAAAAPTRKATPATRAKSVAAPADAAAKTPAARKRATPKAST